MILISILSLFAIVSSQTQRRSVCLKLESVYESICPSRVGRTAMRSLQGPPGKMGPNGTDGLQGKQGRQGIKGEKGSAGEANYGRVEEMISRRIQEVLAEQSQKYSEISNLLEEANERIRNLENKTDYCPIKYDGKCFWIEYGEALITIEEGRTICSAEGGRLANIYSSTHHYMLLRYLRMFGKGNDVGKAIAWLGMTYNQDTNTVFLSDGTPAPYVKWFSGYPESNDISDIYLEARMDWESIRQHLVNAPRVWKPFGAICEK